MAPFPNVIWVCREINGTLSLIYSGPDKQGLYAQVSLDSTIRFSDPNDVQVPRDGEGFYWGFVYVDTGLPAMPPPEAVISLLPKPKALVEMDVQGYPVIPQEFE